MGAGASRDCTERPCHRGAHNSGAENGIRGLPKEVHKCAFRIAVPRRFKKEAEKDADFFSVIAWRATADFVEKYFCKGKWIGVTGAIQPTTWEKEGVKHYSFEILADQVHFVGDKQAESTETAATGIEKSAVKNPSRTAPAGDDYDDLENEDLPF